MAEFIARTIKDRIAIGDDCFILESLPDGRTKITPAPDSVMEEGTKINKELLQPVEDKLQELDAMTEALLYLTGIISFNDCSWVTINTLAQAGKASGFFNVGDEKTITLTTGEQVTLVILGFDHDDLTAGGKAGITFGMKNLLATTYSMDSDAETNKTWEDCEMRTTTLPMLFEQLPDDLKAVIKPVNKLYCDSYLSTPSYQTASDTLFLLSFSEVCGDESTYFGTEGAQYVYYENATKVKRLSNGTGNQYRWWLRSKRKKSSSSASTLYFGTIVNDDSYGANLSQTASGGVAFGFCI